MNPYFLGKGKIDHYNIEFHVPKQGIRAQGKKSATGQTPRKVVENIHLIPDGKDKYILIDMKKNMRRVE